MTIITNKPETRLIACTAYLAKSFQDPPIDASAIRIMTALASAAAEGRWQAVTGGKNNDLFQIEIEDQIVLFKIFGPHQTLEAIERAHSIVESLSQQLDAEGFSLRVPLPFSFQHKTAHRTPDGLCAVYPFLPGETPVILDPDHRFSLGVLLGQLSTALGKVQLPKTVAAVLLTESASDRYTALPYRHHPQVAEAIANTWLQEIDCYIQSVAPKLNSLPCQLIHGDINASNLLEHPVGHLSAVLDFEFATWDIRVMELAVALASHGTDRNGLLQWTPMIEGFTTVRPLSVEELESLPDLVLLRRYDVVLHFIRKYDLNHPEVQHYLTALRDCWHTLFADKTTP